MRSMWITEYSLIYMKMYRNHFKSSHPKILCDAFEFYVYLYTSIRQGNITNLGLISCMPAWIFSWIWIKRGNPNQFVYQENNKLCRKYVLSKNCTDPHTYGQEIVYSSQFVPHISRCVQFSLDQYIEFHDSLEKLVRLSARQVLINLSGKYFEFYGA